MEIRSWCFTIRCRTYAERAGCRTLVQAIERQLNATQTMKSETSRNNYGVCAWAAHRLINHDLGDKYSLIVGTPIVYLDWINY